MFHHITASLRPRTTVSIPYSDGYLTYAALLSSVNRASESASEMVHDRVAAPLIHVSGLFGEFGSSEKRTRKKVYSDNEYTVQIGIADPTGENVYESVAKTVDFGDESLTIGDGEFSIESFEVDQTTPDKILNSASDTSDEVTLSFETPTCIRAPESEVTEMFPHRVPVFNSLEHRWNCVVSPENQVSLTEGVLRNDVFERPDTKSLRTHSAVVGRIDDGSEGRPLKRHGFTGTCTYGFRGASQSTNTAVSALSLFADYLGVGSATSRGCGTVSTTVR